MFFFDQVDDGIQRLVWIDRKGKEYPAPRMAKMIQ